jgi:hypothetical protein
MVASFSEYTLCMMTLGCNVAGIKRMDREEREMWFEKAWSVVQKMHRRHDAHLIQLNRDAARWAYLITLPLKWSEVKLKEAINAGERFWPAGVSGLSFRDSRTRFEKQLHNLFLTEEEKFQLCNPSLI